MKRKKIAKKGAPEAFIQFACAYEGDDCLSWPFGNGGRNGMLWIRVGKLAGQK